MIWGEAHAITSHSSTFFRDMFLKFQIQAGMGSAPVTRSFVNNRSDRAKTLILHRFDSFANVPEEARVEKFDRIRNV